MTYIDYDYLYKIVLIGDTGVGKSSLIMRYSDNVFSDNFISTIGVDFKVITKQLGKHVVKMQIWDTAGQERFRTITSSYYRGCHGIMIVYDVNCHKSFEDVCYWINEVKTYTNLGYEIPVMIVGNKTDVGNRQVSKEEGKNLADKHNADYYETSAKTSDGVENAFEDFIDKIHKVQDMNKKHDYENVTKKYDEGVSIVFKDKKRNKCCK